MIQRRVRDIDYQLMPGTARKTTDIVIERNGVVVVRPPLDYSPEQVDAVVDSKRLWIYRNLAEWRDLNASVVTREFVAGETFLYLGSAYRLNLVNGQSTPVKLKDGRFLLDRQLVESGGLEKVRKAFQDFYTDKGVQRFEQRVAFFSPKVGVQPSSIKVKDMGFRWASCSNTGSLNFHWKCMMAPRTVVDYIVVHELCHLHHRNHSDAFWNEVDKIIPDWKERKAWLRDNGVSLGI
jgi:predicted metal-dependent hydrolase